MSKIYFGEIITMKMNIIHEGESDPFLMEKEVIYIIHYNLFIRSVSCRLLFLKNKVHVEYTRECHDF